MSSAVSARPRLKLALLACMDARIDPLWLFALQRGDAHVIRNAGGIVTDDVIRSLAVSQRLPGTEEIIVVMHDDCGLHGLDEERFADELAAAGSPARWSLGGFDNVEDALRAGLARLRASVELVARDGISGFIFHHSSGTLREVDAPPLACGRVEDILITCVAEELPQSVGRVEAVAGRGIAGDRYLSGTGTWSDFPVQTGCDLTLIEAEVLKQVGLSGAAARRNIVTSGVSLNELVGRRFKIGAVECYGDRLCEPCSHLESLTGVPVATLVHRGGLRVDILTNGQIAVGDPIIGAIESAGMPCS